MQRLHGHQTLAGTLQHNRPCQRLLHVLCCDQTHGLAAISSLLGTCTAIRGYVSHALSRDVAAASSLHSDGLVLLKARDYGKAASLLSAALAIKPFSVSARIELSVATLYLYELSATAAGYITLQAALSQLQLQQRAAQQRAAQQAAQQGQLLELQQQQEQGQEEPRLSNQPKGEQHQQPLPQQQPPQNQLQQRIDLLLELVGELSMIVQTSAELDDWPVYSKRPHDLQRLDLLLLLHAKEVAAGLRYVEEQRQQQQQQQQQHAMFFPHELLHVAVYNAAGELQRTPNTLNAAANVDHKVRAKQAARMLQGAQGSSSGGGNNSSSSGGCSSSSGSSCATSTVMGSVALLLPLGSPGTVGAREFKRNPAVSRQLHNAGLSVLTVEAEGMQEPDLGSERVKAATSGRKVMGFSGPASQHKRGRTMPLRTDLWLHDVTQALIGLYWYLARYFHVYLPDIMPLIEAWGAGKFDTKHDPADAVWKSGPGIVDTPLELQRTPYVTVGQVAGFGTLTWANATSRRFIFAYAMAFSPRSCYFIADEACLLTILAMLRPAGRCPSSDLHLRSPTLTSTGCGTISVNTAVCVDYPNNKNYRTAPRLLHEQQLVAAAAVTAAEEQGLDAAAAAAALLPGHIQLSLLLTDSWTKWQQHQPLLLPVQPWQLFAPSTAGTLCWVKAQQALRDARQERLPIVNGQQLVRQATAEQLRLFQQQQQQQQQSQKISLSHGTQLPAFAAASSTQLPPPPTGNNNVSAAAAAAVAAAAAAVSLRPVAVRGPPAEGSKHRGGAILPEEHTAILESVEHNYAQHPNQYTGLVIKEVQASFPGMEITPAGVRLLKFRAIEAGMQAGAASAPAALAAALAAAAAAGAAAAAAAAAAAGQAPAAKRKKPMTREQMDDAVALVQRHCETNPTRYTQCVISDMKVKYPELELNGQQIRMLKSRRPQNAGRQQEGSAAAAPAAVAAGFGASMAVDGGQENAAMPAVGAGVLVAAVGGPATTTGCSAVAGSAVFPAAELGAAAAAAAGGGGKAVAAGTGHVGVGASVAVLRGEAGAAATAAAPGAGLIVGQRQTGAAAQEQQMPAVAAYQAHAVPAELQLLYQALQMTQMQQEQAIAAQQALQQQQQQVRQQQVEQTTAAAAVLTVTGVVQAGSQQLQQHSEGEKQGQQQVGAGSGDRRGGVLGVINTNT